MGIGTSIFLIAAGAILRWGITDSTVASIKLDVVGTILMVVGVIGLISDTVIGQLNKALFSWRETDG